MKQPLSNWTLTAGQTHAYVPEPIKNNRIPASVPGCVHTDLMQENLIPDPYLDQNENDLQWIGQTDWHYHTTFALTNAQLQEDKLELVCEGLDTIATLFVNEQEVARTYNMHRSYRFDVKPYVQAGENTLRIMFLAPETWAYAQCDKHGYLPSSSFNKPFNFIRKMACNYGWDWGPTLTTSGIWKPIYIEAWSGKRLHNVRPIISLSDDLKTATVTIHADITHSSFDAGYVLKAVMPELGVVCEQAVTDEAHVSLSFVVDNPELWWPVGHGAQRLYELEVTLLSDAINARANTDIMRVGFRKLVLDTGLDDVGSAFTFVVNNKPIFCKGANWIPDDVFVTRVTRERYAERIAQARDAGMNMLRVWGGGIYEQQDFYELCDEAGMLVWQDFLFACAAYPEEEPFWSEVKAEAIDNITRLSRHASLALWNGNNENLWGYVSWDWQAQLENRTWGRGYYLELLPELVRSLSPVTPYWPGSPYSGSEAIHPLADNYGCKHVWDAWNETDYQVYSAYVPRFVSEFGHQGPPAFATMQASISERPLRPESAGMLHHQKALNGNHKLHKRLSEHFRVPDDIHDWHYATQLNQARAVAYGVSYWRTQQPTCMGTLYWQLNDCWPVTSWAAVDGYGRKKPLWYATKKFYADKLLTLQPRGDKLVLFACNDSDELWRSEARIARCSFTGEVFASDSVSFEVAPRSVQAVLVLSEALATPANRFAEVISVRGTHKAERWDLFFESDKRLTYPAAEYDLSIHPTEQGYTLNVTANHLLRDVVLYADKLESDAVVDDQLVTLQAGESVSFEVIATRVPTVEEVLNARALYCANLLR